MKSYIMGIELEGSNPTIWRRVVMLHLIDSMILSRTWLIFKSIYFREYDQDWINERLKELNYKKTEWDKINHDCLVQDGIN